MGERAFAYDADIAGNRKSFTFEFPGAQKPEVVGLWRQK
jgi:hypothetical protein